MRAIDVSRDDRFVVDKDGTIWFAMDYQSEGSEWAYLSSGPSWDFHAELPDKYEPYVALDEAAAEIIRLHLITQGTLEEQR